MDRILITGVSGFIGSYLAKYLLRDENNLVYGIDDFSSSTMTNLYPLLKNRRFHFLEHNLLSEIPFSVDYIYHLAGNGDLANYSKNKYNFILNKIDVLKNIINYTILNGSRIINTSEIAEINNSYIIVNGAKRIASPYEIKAIGDQTYLTSILSLKDSGFIDKYTSDGKIVRLEQRREVQIPKYDGVMEFNYAYEKEDEE